jgi:Flp pilus assembly pilin Flp
MGERGADTGCEAGTVLNHISAHAASADDAPKEKEMLKKVAAFLKNEQGIETLEWIAIGGLILGVAFAVYPGTLRPALTGVVTNIGTALQGVVPAPPAV